MIRGFVFICALTYIIAPAAAQAPAATPPAVEQELCGTLETNGETSSFVPISGYSVLNATPPLVRPAGDVDALVCIRSEIFIGPNDYRVLTELGVPLFIRSANRLAILEMTVTGLRIRFTQGQPTAEESLALGAAIDRAHAEITGRR